MYIPSIVSKPCYIVVWSEHLSSFFFCVSVNRRGACIFGERQHWGLSGLHKKTLTKPSPKPLLSHGEQTEKSYICIDKIHCFFEYFLKIVWGKDFCFWEVEPLESRLRLKELKSLWTLTFLTSSASSAYRPLIGQFGFKSF